MFDPYYKWLGIPREEQPPNHYRLLGLSLLESDPDVIDAAANRQMAYLQGCATGTQVLLSQRLLNEVAGARLCLLSPEKKAAYDARLRAKRIKGSDEKIPSSPSTRKKPRAPEVRPSINKEDHPASEETYFEDESTEIPLIHGTTLQPRRKSKKKRWLVPIFGMTFIISTWVIIIGFILRKENQVTTSEKVELVRIVDSPRKNQDQVLKSETKTATIESKPRDGKKDDDTRKSNDKVGNTPTTVATSKIPETAKAREADQNSNNSDLSTQIPLLKRGDSPGEIHQFLGHGAGVLCVAFTPDGRFAISGSRDKSIRIWDLSDGKEVRQLLGHEAGIWSIAVSKDGHRLASCGPDSTVRLWDLDMGNEIQTFRGHTSWVGCVAFTADSSKLVSSSAHADDLTTRIWDVAKGTEIHRIPQSGAISLYPDTWKILIAAFKTPTLWELSLKNEVRRFNGHRSIVNSVAFSPDGKSLISASGGDMDKEGFTAGNDNSIRLWETGSGRERRRFIGHDNWVNSIAFSPDGKLIISGGGGTIVGHDNRKPGTDMSVRIWDVASGKEIQRFTGHREPVKGVAFSPDGKFALSGSEDATVRLWRLPETTVTATPPIKSYTESLFTRLFNGSNLNGWVGYADAWLVDPKRGVLISPGEGPYVYGAGTKDRFDDFVLRFGYKVLSTAKDRRSGLVLRHTGDSIFLAIGDGDSGDLIFNKRIDDPGKRLRQEKLANGSGGDQFIVKKNVTNEKALGDWNTCEVVCDGPSITVTINGQIVNHVPNATKSSGSIAFTQNGTKAEYRDIRIMPIKAAPSQPKGTGRPR